MANEKVTKLYTILKNAGNTSAKDANEFGKWMAGENYRKQIYEHVKKNGLGGIGKDYAEFSKITGYGQKPVQQASTQQAQSVGASQFGNAQPKQAEAPAVAKQPYTTVEEVEEAPQGNDKFTQWNWEENEPHYTSEVERRQKTGIYGEPMEEKPIPMQPQMSQWEQEAIAHSSSKNMMGKEIKGIVDKAIEKGNKDAREEEARVREKYDWPMLGDPMTNTISIGEIERSIARNRAKSPEKLLKGIQDYLKGNLESYLQSHAEDITRGAEASQMDVASYIDNYVVPKVFAEAEQKLYDEVKRGYMPKSDAEYVLNGFQDWVGTMAFRAVTQTPMQYTLQDEANEEYGKQASWIAKLGKEGVAFGDPAFAASFGGGKAIGEGAQTLIKAGIKKATATKVGQKIASESFKRSAEYASRFGSKAASKVDELISQSSGTRLGAFARKYVKDLPQEIVGQGLGMNIYGALTGSVATYGQTRDAYEAGKMAWEGLTSKEGFASGASFAVMMPLVHNAYGLSGLGWKAGDSAVKKGVMMGAKLGFEGAGIMATAGVMTVGHNLGAWLEGHDMDWTVSTYMEQTAAAAAMKYNLNTIKAVPRALDILKGLGSKKTNNPLPFRLTKDEADEILLASGEKTLDDALYSIFPEGTRSRGNATPEEVTASQERFLSMMNNLSWDAQNKLASALTGSLTVMRPRTARFEYEGDAIKEYDSEGKLLSTKKVSSKEEAEAYMTEKRIFTANGDLMSTIAEAFSRDKTEKKEEVYGIVATLAEQWGVNANTVWNVVKKAPSRRTEAERRLMKQLDKVLQDYAYPQGEAHVEPSRIQGGQIADEADLIGENPQIGEVAELNAEVDGAQEMLRRSVEDKSVVWAEDYLSMKEEGMTDAQALERLMESYNETDLAVLADAVNAQAKQEGFMSKVSDNIDTAVSARMNTLTHRTGADGKTREVADDVIVMEGPNGEIVYYTGGTDGRTVMKNGKEHFFGVSMMVIDANGEPRVVSVDKYSIKERIPARQYEDMYREELGTKATDIIDPEGKLNPEMAMEEVVEQPKEEMVAEEPMREEVVEEAPIEAVEEVKPEVVEELPRDEQGELDYMSEMVTPEKAKSEIYDESGLTREEADMFTESRLSEARKAREAKEAEGIAMQEGEGVQAYKKRKEQYQQELEELRRREAKWEEIRSQAEEKKTAEEVKQEIEAELELKAEEERQKLSAEEESRRKPLRRLAEKRGIIALESVEDIEDAETREKAVADKGVRAFTLKGKNYVLLDRISDPKEIEQIFVHEEVIHNRLKNLLGEDHKTFFETLYDQYMTESEKASMEDYVYMSENPSKALKAEEFLATHYETMDVDNPGLWERVKTAIRAGLRKMGVELEFNDTDIKTLIREAYKGKEKSSVAKYVKSSREHETGERGYGQLEGYLKVRDYISPDKRTELDDIFQEEIYYLSDERLQELNDKYKDDLTAAELEGRKKTESEPSEEIHDQEIGGETAEMKESVMEGQSMFSKKTNEANYETGEEVRFSKREEPDPKKTQKVYKLMRLGEDGKLYPLYIDNASAVELGQWYNADSPNLGDLKKLPSGTHLIDAEGKATSWEDYKAANNLKGKKPNADVIRQTAENGSRWVSIVDKPTSQKRYEGENRSYYNLGINGSGQVGEFAMRPGWHAGSLPTMRQIGKGKNKDLRDDSFVWVEGEVSADKDYQQEADNNPDKDIPTHIPTDGYYLKATNANKKASQADRVGWYVAGAFKPNRIIGDSEARSIIDKWNAEHPSDPVEYDFARESGKDFEPEGTRFSKAMETNAEKEIPNIVLKDTKEKKLPTNREEAFAYIPASGVSYLNKEQGVNVRVSRNSVKHTSLHGNKDTFAIFAAMDQIIGNAVKIGSVPVAQDEVGHTRSVNIFYTPINVNGNQYSARLVVKELENKGVVLDELSLYNVSMHKEKGSAVQPLSASKEVGGITTKPISAYKVKDLIHNTQENDKKILGIEDKTTLFSKNRFHDGMSADEMHDMMGEHTEWSSGPSNLIRELEKHYKGEIIGASSGARHAMREGLMPVPGGKYSGQDGEYHHIEFRGKDGETYVESVPFAPAESVGERTGTLFSARMGSAFSGGGLVEAGLADAVDKKFAIEYNEKIAGVYRNNHGNHILVADIRDVDMKDLADRIDGPLDYFHASPVCKRYSGMNANQGEVELDKETAQSTADIIKSHRPEVVTIENVPGYKNSEAMEIITKTLDEEGYNWDSNVYDASDYGAATSRKRLIIRASKDALPELPSKVTEKTSWYEATKDLIDELPTSELPNWMAERLQKDGIDYKNITEPLFVLDGGSPNGKARYAWGSEPLPTIVASGSADRIVLPGGEVKLVSPRVLARITGLSDDYQLPKSRTLAHTVIGNGVPVALTKSVIAPMLDKFQDKNKAEVKRIEDNVGEVDAEKGDVRFSAHTVLKGKEKEDAIKDLMNVTGRSKRTVEKWIKAEESLASVILREDNLGILDIEADESVPSIWKNSDYPQGTVEFSNICKKRLPFTTIYQRLQKEFPNTLFDAQTLNTIRNTMKEMGEDVACALCFVEDRRQLLGEIGQGFIDAVKGMNVELNGNQKVALDKLRESGDKYVPNLFDIITLDGMKELRKKHPSVAQAFVEYNNARGMQSGRLFQAYSAYNREILKYHQKKVESINNNGGLRIFSFSDFEAHHLIDLVQVLTDCAAKGIKVQGYTKVPEFAKAVKDTNAKINRSLIPKGDGYVDADYVPKEGEAVSPNVINGKRLLFDTVEGIDVNNPNFFDSTNSKSVGNILVAINDEHARLAMADPFVDYIIGFHTGQSKAILKGKGIDTWVNYKNEQLDKVVVTDEKGKEKMKNAPHHGLNIYTDVLNVAEAEGNPIKTAKQFTERFIEECNKRGWIPRFHRFLDKGKDGGFRYTPGYHKFLIDFKLFDKNGKIVPQEAVVPKFDTELNKQILDNYVKGVKEEMPNDAVYEAVKEAIGLGDKGAENIDKPKKTAKTFTEMTEGAKFSVAQKIWNDKNEVYKDMREHIKKTSARTGWNQHEGVISYLKSQVGKTNEAMWQDVRNKIAEATGTEPTIADVQMALWEEGRKGDGPMNHAERIAKRREIINSIPEAKTDNGEYVESDGAKFSVSPMGASARDWYDRQIKKASFKWEEAHVDRMASLRELQTAIGGSNVKDSENVYDRENHASSIAHAEWQKYHAQTLQPLEKEVGKIIGILGRGGKEGKQEITDYLIKKSGLERNRVLFVRDALKEMDDTQKADTLAQDFEAEREALLRTGDYYRYLTGMDAWIDANIEKAYDRNKNDYSGISVYDPQRQLKDGKLESYDEEMIIDDVLDFDNSVDTGNLWKAVRKATDFALDYSYNSGTISKDALSHMKKMFGYYIPLRGYRETTMEDVYDTYLNRDHSLSDTNVIKNAKGRHSLADDPLAYISSMANGAIVGGERNKTKQYLYRLAENNPNNLAIVSKVWMEKVTDSQGNVTWEVRTPDLSRRDLKPDEMADIINDFNNDMEAKKAQGLAKEVDNDADYPRKFREMEHENEHVVSLKVNGQRRHVYIVGNPRAAQAINGQLVDSGKNAISKPIINAMAKLTTSWSPEFILSNLQRDTLFTNANVASREGLEYWLNYTKNQAKTMAYLFGKGGKNSLMNRYLRGEQMTTQKERLFKEFMNNGGRTGFIAMQNLEEHKRELEKTLKAGGRWQATKDNLDKVLSAIFSPIATMNDRAELVNRFATYRTSREMGRSIQRSITDAKNISANFNRKGAGDATSGTVGQLAGFFQGNYMFYNATIQGLSVVGKNLGKNKSTAFKSVMFMGLLPTIGGAMHAIACALLDDEKYSKIPHWDRRNNICIPLKEGYLKIALPHEIRAFWGAGDIFAGLVDKRLRTGEDVGTELAGTFTQLLPLNPMSVYTMLPTAIQPIYGSITNEDWSGKPIRKDNKFFEEAPKYTLAFDSTPDFMVEFTKWVHNETREGVNTDQDTDASGIGNISPADINYLIKSYLGGIYSMTAKTVNFADNLIEGELQLSKAPLLSRVAGSYSSGEADAVTNARYYRYVEEADLFGKEFGNKKNKTNPLARAELMNSPRYKRWIIIKQRSGQIKALGKQYKEAEGEKRKAIGAQIAQLKSDVVEALDQIE